MKKTGIILLVFCLNISSICIGQAVEGRVKTVEELRKDFLTAELSLTAEEANKFFPIYYDYWTELKKLRKEGGEDEIETAENVLNVRKKFKEEFKSVLGNDERVNKVFLADKKFKKILEDELNARKRNKQKSISSGIQRS